MRKEIIEFLSPFGFDFEKGVVQSTDVDLAIIDRKSKVCLCLELKWFIEPAEIWEIVDRSKDLHDGIEQARKLNALHQASDQRLVKDILKIDASYSFLSVVVSRNWIGHDDIQCPDVPIIKSVAPPQPRGFGPWRLLLPRRAGEQPRRRQSETRVVPSSVSPLHFGARTVGNDARRVNMRPIGPRCGSA